MIEILLPNSYFLRSLPFEIHWTSGSCTVENLIGYLYLITFNRKKSSWLFEEGNNI